MHLDRREGDTPGLPQEGGLALVGLDAFERDSGGNRQHQPWKAAAGAKIDPARCAGADQGNQLQRVGDVAPP